MASDVTNETHEMVKVDQPQQLPMLSAEQDAAMQLVLGDLAGPKLHNFSGDPRELWRQTARATSGDVKNWKDLKGESFPLKHFYVHTVKMRNIQSGKIDNGIRTVLISPSGEMVACVSTGIARDLAGLIQANGMGPYDPPIDVHFTDIRTRAGFSVLRLIPA